MVGQIYGIDLCSELELEYGGSRAEVRGLKGQTLGAFLGEGAAPSYRLVLSVQGQV